MFSKAIKISTLIITTIIYGSLVHLLLFSNQISDLNLYLKWLDDTSIISDIGQTIMACFVLFGPVLALFFAFMMRAIDWHNEKGDGGKVWILGGILAFFIFKGMHFLANNMQMSPNTVITIVLSFGYLLCILAIFVKQGQAESSGESRPKNVWGDTCTDTFGGDGGCAHGGCM